MENTHESPGMKRVYGLVKGLNTPTEQNLAAALLDMLKHQTEAKKAVKRKRKTA